MDINAKNQAFVQKMIDGVKLAVFLSLATNLYEVYSFVNEPSGFRRGISIALGIIATLLIWKFRKELQAKRKQALYYWLGLAFIGYSRWIFIDATFNLNIISVALMSLTAVLTLRIVSWVRNKQLA